MKIPDFLKDYLRKKYPNKDLDDVVIACALAFLLMTDDDFRDYVRNLDEAKIWRYVR